jgi:hypothetical protein
MASNARTPQSVLDAPTLTPVTVSAQPGQNRAARRHVTLNAKGQRVNPGLGKTLTIPKAARQPASNEPYEDQVKSWHRRGKKARRHALRFDR